MIMDAEIGSSRAGSQAEGSSGGRKDPTQDEDSYQLDLFPTHHFLL